MNFKHNNISLDIYNFDTVVKIWGDKSMQEEIFKDRDPFIAQLKVDNFEAVPDFINLKLSDLVSLEYVVGKFISELMRAKMQQPQISEGPGMLVMDKNETRA